MFFGKHWVRVLSLDSPVKWVKYTPAGILEIVQPKKQINLKFTHPQGVCTLNHCFGPKYESIIFNNASSIEKVRPLLSSKSTNIFI